MGLHYISENRPAIGAGSASDDDDDDYDHGRDVPLPTNSQSLNKIKEVKTLSNADGGANNVSSKFPGPGVTNWHGYVTPSPAPAAIPLLQKRNSGLYLRPKYSGSLEMADINNSANSSSDVHQNGSGEPSKGLTLALIKAPPIRIILHFLIFLASSLIINRMQILAR
ncbi:hypothetical protein QYF36_017451 [Acer negundo]|nr:hypothetical protein QYF36_017451 [Acer negundo]